MTFLRRAWQAIRNVAAAALVVAAAIAVLEAAFRLVGIHRNLATALPVLLLSILVWINVLAHVWRTAYRLAGGAGRTESYCVSARIRPARIQYQ